LLYSAPAGEKYTSPSSIIETQLVLFHSSKILARDDPHWTEHSVIPLASHLHYQQQCPEIPDQVCFFILSFL
jgi:hypothetical protein